MLERCGHVAEPRRAAEQQAVGLDEIGQLRVRRSVGGHRIAGGTLDVVVADDGRYGADPSDRAGAFDAARRLTRESGGTAAARVVQH